MQSEYLKALSRIIKQYAKLRTQAIHKQESGAYLLALLHEENDRKAELYRYYQARNVYH